VSPLVALATTLRNVPALPSSEHVVTGSVVAGCAERRGVGVCRLVAGSAANERRESGDVEAGSVSTGSDVADATTTGAFQVSASAAVVSARMRHAARGRSVYEVRVIATAFMIVPL